MKRRRSNRSTSTSTDRSSAVPTPLARTFTEKGKEVSKPQAQIQSKGTAAERLGQLQSRYSKQVDSSKRVTVEESSDDDDDDEPQSSSPRRSPIKKSIIRDSDDEELIPTKTQSQPQSSFDPVLSGTPALPSLSTKTNNQGKKRGIPQISREAFAPFLTERTGVPLESESLGNRDSMQMQSSEDHRGKAGDPKKKSKLQGQQQQVKGTKLMKLGMPSTKATGNEIEEDEISDDVMSSPIRDFSDEEMLGVQEKEIDLDEDAILAPNSDLSTQEQARLRKSSQVNGLPRVISSHKKKAGESSRSIDRNHASSQLNGKVASSLDLSLSHAELRAQPGSPAAKGQVLKLVQTSEHFPYFLRDDVEKYLQKAKIAVPKSSTNQAHSQSQSQSQSQSVTADESDGFKYLHLKDTWTLQLDEGDASSWGTNEAEAEETVLVLILWMDANTYDVQLISKESLSDLQSKFECDPWVDNNGRDWKGVIRPKDIPRSTSNWSQNHRKNESSMDMESLSAMNASLLLAIEELRKEKTTLAVQRDDAIDAKDLLEEEKEEWENLRAEFQEELAASGLTGEGKRALGTESEVKSLVKELKKQLNQTQKDKISALEDVDYFQQEARNATASASNMSIELQAAQSALQKVTRQLEVGLANQRDATKKHRQTLEDKIRQLEIQNKILVSQNAKTNDDVRKKAALWDAMEAREKEEKEAEKKKKEKVEGKKEQERLEALKELEDEARELQSLAELEGEPIAVDLSSGRASRSRRRGPAPVVDSAAPPSVAPQPPIAQQLPALVQAQVHQDAPQSNIESEAANLEMNELPSSHAGQIVEENNPTDLGALASPEISASMEAALQTQVPYPETQMSQIPSSPASLPNSDILQTQANPQTQASRSTETNPKAAPKTNATPRSSTSSSHNTPLAFGFGFNQAPTNQSRPSFTGFGFSSPSRPFAALRHSFGSNASAQSSTEALVEPQVNANEAEKSADKRREEEESLEKEDQQQPQGNAWLVSNQERVLLKSL